MSASTLINLSAPTEPASANGMPLLRLGFRPFYLGAAACAAVFMVLWRFVFTGDIVVRTGLAPVLWHAHEMLFGFAAAVIVGFLFTAGKTWTGLPTPRGARLAWLFLLWSSARVASLLAPYPIYFLLDVVFLPIAAALFLTLLVRAGNKRNLPIAGVLILLSLANLGFHLGAIQLLPIPAVQTLYAALSLIVVLVSIIAGRVMPMFTANVTPGLKLVANPRRDVAATLFTTAGLGLWAAGLWPTACAVALLIACALHTARLVSWAPWVSRRRPILWVLHASYAWIPVGLALLAAAQVGWLPVSAGVHALTVGAIGGMVIGMMSRTARGHTGRNLQASKVETAAFTLVALAAVARVGAALLPTPVYWGSLMLAGVLWALAFSLYLIRFTPWLVAARLDGQDG